MAEPYIPSLTVVTGPLSPPGAVAAERKGFWERAYGSWALLFGIAMSIDAVAMAMR